jgi:hypothetical protein
MITALVTKIKAIINAAIVSQQQAIELPVKSHKDK